MHETTGLKDVVSDSTRGGRNTPWKSTRAIGARNVAHSEGFHNAPARRASAQNRLIYGQRL
jgi:hypothetical protein